VLNHTSQMVLLGIWMAVVGSALIALSRYASTHPDFIATYMRFGHPQTPEWHRASGRLAGYLGGICAVGGTLLVILAVAGYA
jgi:hypothetical protein